ncbi:MAG: glycosyltransferase family 2 protein [Planctomycetes bacterium]|nr:glycosyltransferase family 2 protein [Planctomycetota bacterium]MBI3835755.1 glycosyltransferase family 2 protein [Planctomycetota bacterium]
MVSIIIPTYQRAALLPRALNSVAAQTNDDWEAIVVDDGSTDDTKEVVRQFASKTGRIRYVHQPNQGASAARNRGIDAASGEFVAFLDSDDEYLPKMIERELSLFRRAPTLGLVFSDYSYVDLDGLLHGSALCDFFPIVHAMPRELIETNSYLFPLGIKDWLGQSYFVSTIAGMVRRDVLGDAIRFSREHGYAEEWLFFGQVAERCQVGFVNESLALHHFTPGSMTRNGEGNHLGRVKSLMGMLNGIDSLTHLQRQKLRLQLSDAFAGMRYTKTRVGNEWNSCVYSWKSFLQSPTLRGLGRSAKQACRAIVASLNGSDCGRSAAGNE